jgi:uncharacterized protein (TIGR02452 family)
VKRSGRGTIAKQTVEIIEQGRYTSPSGLVVDIQPELKACIDGTRHFSPEDLSRLLADLPATEKSAAPVRLEVANETTLAGIAQLVADGVRSVVALNFASAKNPGGGFLGGSEAQEESLARSSCLYASLMKAWNFYETHRAMRSLLYSDAMIYTPDCPVLRDDEGNLLDQPRLASFITSPAPNAGAIGRNRPDERSQILEVLIRRGELILALAAAQGHRELVLGAWGCGVFRNDPEQVAEMFVGHLRSPRWSRRFDRVRFSVLDTSADQNIFRAFESALAG